MILTIKLINQLTKVVSDDNILIMTLMKRSKNINFLQRTKGWCNLVEEYFE